MLIFFGNLLFQCLLWLLQSGCLAAFVSLVCVGVPHAEAACFPVFFDLLKRFFVWGCGGVFGLLVLMQFGPGKVVAESTMAKPFGGSFWRNQKGQHEKASIS